VAAAAAAAAVAAEWVEALNSSGVEQRLRDAEQEAAAKAARLQAAQRKKAEAAAEAEQMLNSLGSGSALSAAPPTPQPSLSSWAAGLLAKPSKVCVAAVLSVMVLCLQLLGAQCLLGSLVVRCVSGGVVCVGCGVCVGCV
jgi:hypothetical protein